MSDHGTHIASLLARYPAHQEHADSWGDARLRVGEHLLALYVAQDLDEHLAGARAVELGEVDGLPAAEHEAAAAHEGEVRET